MLFKKTLLGTALVLCLGSVNAADKATFDSAYSAAEAARKGAAAVKFEWRDTKKMLKKAKALAKKGDYAKAVAMANKAKFEGEAGQAQAAQQEKQWRSFVIK
jgi:hypothetical protein